MNCLFWQAANSLCDKTNHEPGSEEIEKGFLSLLWKPTSVSHQTYWWFLVLLCGSKTCRSSSSEGFFGLLSSRKSSCSCTDCTNMGWSFCKVNTAVGLESPPSVFSLGEMSETPLTATFCGCTSMHMFVLWYLTGTISCRIQREKNHSWVLEPAYLGEVAVMLNVCWQCTPATRRCSPCTLQPSSRTSTATPLQNSCWISIMKTTASAQRERSRRATLLPFSVLSAAGVPAHWRWAGLAAHCGTRYAMFLHVCTAARYIALHNWGFWNVFAHGCCPTYLFKPQHSGLNVPVFLTKDKTRMIGRGAINQFLFFTENINNKASCKDPLHSNK